MNRVSRARQVEVAVQLVLWGLREGHGQMPLVTRGAWKQAARLLRLDASGGDSWTMRSDPGPYLEAAGFDKTGRIIDWERYYAYIDAHKPKSRKNLRSRIK